MSLGREIRLPADLVYKHDDPSQQEPTFGEHVTVIRERMQHAHEIARRHLGSSAKRSKARYDIRTSYHDYKVGDTVWMLHEMRRVGTAPKLEKRYNGPFIIIQRRSAVNFLVQLDDAGDERLMHHDKLKMYEGPNLPKWVKRVKRKLTRNTDPTA